MQRKELETIKQLVTQISNSIIEYETGNVMIISSLMDVTEKIESLCNDKMHLTHICAALNKMCEQELTKENPEFSKIMSNGIDALKDILNTDANNFERKNRRDCDLFWSSNFVTA